MSAFVQTLREVAALIFDAVLPRRARTLRTESLDPTSIPVVSEVRELLGQRITTLMDYEDPNVAALIQSLKYDASIRAAQLCASVLAEYLTEEIASSRHFSQKKILLIPIPLHATRRRERGFNQIERVLDALPHEFTSAMIARDILVRTRATNQQTRLRKSARLSNVAGAFALADNRDLKKMHVYLIDDVTTTGATLVNAANPLKRAGATVTLIALARA